MRPIFLKFARQVRSKAATACGVLVGILVASTSCADLYVVQVGDGAAALSTASAAAFIKKFADAGGSPTATINLPTAVAGSNKALTLSGSATSEGFLALSTNGQYLTMAGYDAVPGTAAVAQTDSTVVNRVIGRIDVNTGSIDTTTALTDAYTSGGAASNSNIRSAVSSDGTQFWTTGTAAAATTASAGVRYSELGGTTSTQVSSTPTNTRVVNIANGQLYVTTASGSNIGVNSIGSGLPTGSGETTSLLPGFSAATGTGNASPYDFWFKDANTAYVADDRTQASGGGIQKWLFNAGSGNWELAYTLATGSGSNSGARALAGSIVGSDTILYATTTAAAANRLVKIIDSGAGALYSDLATAPANTAFRGVEFVTANVGVPGDYNGDGKVDAADYVLWRDNPGSFGGDPAGYNTWRANFGTGGGAGSGLGSSAAVPEPASLVLLMFGMGIVGVRRR
jgi:hypothetical protein